MGESLPGETEGRSPISTALDGQVAPKAVPTLDATRGHEPELGSPSTPPSESVGPPASPEAPPPLEKSLSPELIAQILQEYEACFMGIQDVARGLAGALEREAAAVNSDLKITAAAGEKLVTEYGASQIGSIALAVDGPGMARIRSLRMTKDDVEAASALIGLPAEMTSHNPTDPQAAISNFEAVVQDLEGRFALILADYAHLDGLHNQDDELRAFANRSEAVRSQMEGEGAGVYKVDAAVAQFKLIFSQMSLANAQAEAARRTEVNANISLAKEQLSRLRGVLAGARSQTVGAG